MAFPAGITLRTVNFGIPFGFADGADLTMSVTFTPDRSLVWAASGDPAIARPKVVKGAGGSIDLPVTDQAGWRNASGLVSVAAGAQAFLYKVQVAFFDAFDQQAGPASDPFTMALPLGDGSPIDLDLQTPFVGADGVVVAVPDSWSAQVTAAQAAAQAAQAALASAVPVWQASTAYTAGRRLVAPDGSIVQVATAHTSTGSYDASKFTVLVPTGASNAATYSTKGQALVSALIFGS